MLLFRAIFMVFLARLCASEHPLEANEILEQIQVPDEDGTEGKTMDEVLLDANTQVVQRPIKTS